MAMTVKPKVSKLASEKKRASVEAAIRKKRECEKKALGIVEYLVENEVTTSNWLVENSRYINPQYYDDVTEERSIIKICGFPLCSNVLTKVQNKKFAISTKTNKVYDITERKKFCSDKCFSKSKHFKDQLPTSPLWMREDENFHEIEIPETLKCIPGDEVLVTSVELPEDNKDDEEKALMKQEEEKKQELKKKKVEERSSAPRSHPCDVVFRSLRQWICVKTLDWLESNGDLSEDEEVDELNKRMTQLKMKVQKEDQPPAEYKPAISYDALKRGEKHAEVKVRAFFSGRWEYACEEDDKEETIDEECNQTDPEAVEVPIVMPLANLSAQRALRRKIVLDYLEKWLVVFSTSYSLKLRQYQNDLHDLVFTFNLTADTITFRPEEIPILSAAILLMIGKRNVTVNENLQDPQLQEKFSEILNPYDSSLVDIGDFLEDLVGKCRENRPR